MTVLDKGNMAVVGKNFAIMEIRPITAGRVRGLAGLVLCSPDVSSSAAKPASRPEPVALELFHRTAQFAV
jgi:hypothetical protein